MSTSTNPQADTGVASPADVKEPPTGAEFLESLRDGRVIYFDGEEINDVTTHPAFAPVPVATPACTTRSTIQSDGTS